MDKEKYYYVPTSIYYKSIWEIKCNIASGKIKIDNSDICKDDTYLELALMGVPLPEIYATDDKFGNMTIFKGSNILDKLLKYIDNKKNIEKYRARIESVKVSIIKLEYCPENNYRIEEIKKLINKI